MKRITSSASVLSISVTGLLVAGCFAPSDVTTIPSGAASSTNQSTTVLACNPADPDFLAGDGSLANPYQISTVCHLASLASSKYSGLNFILVADIDMTGFNEFSAFVLSGTLDGKNHTLSNWIGITPLFDDVTGTIQNLVVKNFTITDSSRVAPLANYVGTTGKITNVASINGSVTSNNSFAGGLVGENDGTITHSQSSTAVIAGEGGGGGLVGVNHGTILTSFATGAVTGDSAKGDGNQVGGLVGINMGTITNCAAGGRVIGMTQVGGFAGINVGTINNSFSVGLVSGTGTNIGGFVGQNALTNASFPIQGVSTGTVNASYWDKIASNQNASDGGTGETTLQMQTPVTFAGFDFVGTWFAPTATTYPSLR